jgi:hypothetical protein
MSRLHRVGRILLATQAPSTNTQWLSAVEHVKTHAQQNIIKALPLGHLLNLMKNARTLHYNKYEHDVVMAVFEATAWLQTRVSALPGGGGGLDFDMPQQPRTAATSTAGGHGQ